MSVFHSKKLCVLAACACAIASLAGSGRDSAVDPLAGIDIKEMKRCDGVYCQKLDNGRKAIFTVDPELQRFADQLFEKYEVPAGAAVVINSRTGKVLALSQSRRIADAADAEDVAFDPSPPAASLFKVVTASALIGEKKATFDTTTCYQGGSQKLLMRHIEEEPGAGANCASLTDALGKSINAIFAKLADKRLNRDILLRYAERFGFNKEIRFDVPVPRSKAEIPSDRLELARTAAGFWHTHISPLHAAMIAQAVAHDGTMLKPYIVEKVESDKGALLYRAETGFISRPIDKETAAAVARAMASTVERGTARKSFQNRSNFPNLRGIEIAGKTGSLTGDRPYRAYTWFIGVAPIDNPKVAFSVLVVNKPKWRIKASGIAVQILEKYFEISKKKADHRV